MRLLLLLIHAMALAAATMFDAQDKVRDASHAHIHRALASVPAAFVAIVPGCRVTGDAPSACLEERLSAALALFRAGRVQRLLLSGDHGTRGYDEVNTMKGWFMAHGVPADVIFLDHAGFDTYDTMVRARQVFRVDDAVVVSQAFHLYRAVFLARAVGLRASGYAADPPEGSACGGSAVREPLACLKAVLDVLLSSQPRFLGPAIPVEGSPEASFDRH